MENTIQFTKVGQLKKAIEGLKDETFVACQVVAENGEAWNMWGEFCRQVPGGNISCLTFRHSDLKTLNQKDKILSMITDKIKSCEEKQKDKLIIDRIDVVALKELYNLILEQC